jgi:peptide/nickel transport system permease protein
MDALLADPGMTIAEIERRKEQIGLNQPIFVQYLVWLKELLQGNLGFSYSTYRPVADMIFERMGATLLLTVSAVLLSYIIGVPLGIMSSLKPYSIRDYTSSTLAFVASGFPGFFLGMMLVFFFSIKLKWLPMGGMYGSDGTRSIFAVVRHLTLPSLSIAIPEIGKVLRHVRNTMLEVLQEDYVRTAKAKGVSPSGVVVVHAFRNSLIPVVTVFSGSIPFMFGGAVVMERVFSWPGLGTLMINSITSRDYPVIMGISVIIAIVVLLANLLADLLYGLLDPRISYR